MATKGKTRGPKESKHVSKSAKDEANYQTKQKKVEKVTTGKKK